PGGVAGPTAVEFLHAASGTSEPRADDGGAGSAVRRLQRPRPGAVRVRHGSLRWALTVAGPLRVPEAGRRRPAGRAGSRLHESADFRLPRRPARVNIRSDLPGRPP